jgi:riboflavin biosynthesis pyrimidine reductase
MSPSCAAASRSTERSEILCWVSATLLPLGPAGRERAAGAIVEGLRLSDAAAGQAARPRVVAAMIASVDGRASVEGSASGLGHPADQALLRELRAAVDAILVGTGTLRAERYANVLDDDQRERRAHRGLDREPVVATISRSGDVPVDVPLFAEPDARIEIYAEAEVPGLDSHGAQVDVHRFPPGGARPTAVLEHLVAARGVRSVLCEGGPTLLRAIVAEQCVDHLMFTLAPLLVAGEAAAILAGDELRPPARFALREVHRAGEHLFMHYVPGA